MYSLLCTYSVQNSNNCQSNICPYYLYLYVQRLLLQRQSSPQSPSVSSRTQRRAPIRRPQHPHSGCTLQPSQARLPPLHPTPYPRPISAIPNSPKRGQPRSRRRVIIGNKKRKTRPAYQGPSICHRAAAHDRRRQRPLQLRNPGSCVFSSLNPKPRPFPVILSLATRHTLPDATNNKYNKYRFIGRLDQCLILVGVADGVLSTAPVHCLFRQGSSLAREIKDTKRDSSDTPGTPTHTPAHRRQPFLLFQWFSTFSRV